MNEPSRQRPGAALAAVVRQLYAGGASYNAIAAELNKRGERGVQGGRWFAASVRLLLLQSGDGKTNQ